MSDQIINSVLQEPTTDSLFSTSIGSNDLNDSPYLYGKLNNKIRLVRVEYEGRDTDTTHTYVNNINEEFYITVDVKKLPHSLVITRNVAESGTTEYETVVSTFTGQENSNILLHGITLCKLSNDDIASTSEAEYALVQDGLYEGPKIVIPKHKEVINCNLVYCEIVDIPYEGAQVGDPYLDITSTDGHEITHIYISLKDLLNIYVAGDGLTLDPVTHAFNIDWARLHEELGSTGNIDEQFTQVNETLLNLTPIYVATTMNLPNVGNIKTMYIVGTGEYRTIYAWDSVNLSYYIIANNYNEIKTINGGNASG